MRCIYLLVLIFSLFSCTNTSNDNIENKYPADEAFIAFTDAFPTINTPLEFKDDLAKESERISNENAIEYLDIKWLDESLSMPTHEIRPFGKYQANDSTIMLIYRTLELPVGSGDNVSYRMSSFRPNGMKVDEVEVARFSSWNGGYQEQTFVMQEDYSIKAEYKSENDEKKESKYNINIQQNGGKFVKTDNKSKVQPKLEPINNSFEIIDVSNADLSDQIKKDYSGQFRMCKSWNDKLGKNYLVFSTKTLDDDKNEDSQNHYLYVKHYIDEGENFPKILWKTLDKVEECMFDNMLNLINGSVNITDIDKDNIAETTYMYTIGCVSDVSPLDLKLIMHEGEKKMAIRGSTRLSMANEITDSDYKVDEKSFKGQPDSFKSYAKNIWAKHETLYY